MRSCCFEYSNYADHYEDYDEDIISPMWDFIEIDQQKQGRIKKKLLTQYRPMYIIRHNKLMQSRSGYKGVKLLKRLNRRK